MTGRLWNRFTYWLERTIVRGAQYRLLLIAALIGIISMFGGWAVVAAGTGFDRPADAVWWAFLRLTDPGYLGDDVGTFNRTVSTVLTVLGYVIFLGALVAVMTQWLNARMMRLEQGLTPVARNDHVLILGLNNRTDQIVREVLLSEERVRRFLSRHGTRALHIVVLADGVDAAIVQDLRDAVGDAWDERKVTLRSGTPLRVEHLSRVDIRHAAVIVVPGSEFDEGGSERTDSLTVKTLLSLASELSRDDAGPHPSTSRADWPLVVAEIFDARKIPIARKAYPGPLEILASDATISRLIAQNIRHRGLSHVFNEILTDDDRGSEIYIRDHPELDGTTFDRLGGAFATSILLGVLREGVDGLEAHLNPGPGFMVRAGDRFVHLAEDYAQTSFSGLLPENPWPRGDHRVIEHGRRDKRVLILGWSPKVPRLIQEFETYGDDGFEVVVLSSMPAADRERALARLGGTSRRVVARHVEGDFTEIAELTDIAPHEFDTVLVVGSDRRQGEGEDESDARAIVGSLLLNEMGLPTDRTQTILELLDPENVRLLDSSRNEVLISPLILSHMLAHVALRPELGAVFGELFTAGGAEIAFRTLPHYVPEGHAGPTITFGDVQRAAHAAGEVALGIQSGPAADGLHLGPSRDHLIPLDAGVLIVTVVTY